MQDNYEGQAAPMGDPSVEDLFVGNQETYAQAQQRALEENKSFAKTDYFRMDKFGVYRLRVLPIAPSTDRTAARPGYEYPVHQLLLEIERPGAGNSKQASMYVTVTRATDAGYSVDLIDAYRKAAVEAAKEKGTKNCPKDRRRLLRGRTALRLQPRPVRVRHDRAGQRG